MARTINTILNLQDKFTPKLTEAKRQTLLFQNQLRSCNGTAKSIDSALNKLGKTAVAVAGAGVAAMGAFAASAVKTYGEFQQSMSNVAGILSIDESSEAYQQLEQAARDAGKSTTKTAKESADALSYMALAGWNTQQSMDGLMPILRASEATGADLATTSDLVTDSMSALGLQTSQLTEYLDICARAQNKSNTTLTQMQEAYIGVGGTFKTFHTPLQESAALLGILANRGIKGSEAGNRLQSVLVNLTRKSGQNYKAMQAIGVSAYDAQGNFKGVTNVLREVAAATANMSEEERNNNLQMIAGKTQLTTLNALLSGLSATTQDGANEFQALYDSLGTANGALDAMADTMTDNYEGSLARAKSALDDLKITLGKSLEPYISQFLEWFAERLPGATERFATWLEINVPKAIKACQDAFNKIRPAIGFVADNFSTLAEVALAVVAGLKAFSIATKVVTFLDKLKKATSLAQAAQLAFNTSLLASPITAVIAGVTALAGAFIVLRSASKRAMEENIASHFGSIELSAEECQRAVENVFGQKLIGDVEDLNRAWDNLDDTMSSLSDSASELNKMNFELKFDASSVSKEDYLGTANQYITDLQQAIKDKQFELVLDTNFLFGQNSQAANLFNTDNNAYWTQMLQDAQSLGNEFVTNISNGYANGWDEKSMDMVAKSLQKMSEIQEKIKTAQAESQMELLGQDFAMGDLSQESFDTYLEKISEQQEAITQAANEAASNAMAAQKLQLSEGTISQSDYDTNVTDILNARNEKIASTVGTGLSAAMDAISQAFPEEAAKVTSALQSSLANVTIDPNDLEGSMEGIQWAVENAFNNANIHPAAKKKIGEYVESLTPSADQLKNAIAKSPSLAKEYGDTLVGFEALSTLSGNGSKVGETVVNSIDSQGNIQKAESASKRVLNAVIKPWGEKQSVTLDLDINFGDAANQVTSMVNNLTPVQNTITAAVTRPSTGGAASTPSTPPKQTTFGSLLGRASGTPYFGGGLTEINERGGEVINLPTGAQIIPSDKSAQMVRDTAYFGSLMRNAQQPSVQKQYGDISVTVNLNGGDYNSNDIANEVGNVVCNRIVECLAAV